MKKYEGLDVPTADLRVETDLERQYRYCMSTSQCDLCENCIFDVDNLDKFLKWEKENDNL